MARWPEPPDVRLAECAEGLVCIPVDDILALSIYLGDVAEVKTSMANCPYVVYRD